MSVTEPVEPVEPVPAVSPDVDAGSLADRVAARRRQREARRASILTIPVPGYADLFAANYRRLTPEEKGDILERFDTDENGVPKDRVGSSIDMLIKACVDLLEVTGKDDQGKPVYQSTGKRWTSGTVADLFGVDEVQIAGRPSLRETMRVAIDGEDLMEHFLAYASAVSDLGEEDQKELPGESEPSEEG